MKIRKALEKIKNMKPSQYTDDVMIDWLSALDGQVWETVLRRYGVPAPVLPYRQQMLERELLIPFPHDEVYIAYLGAKIDYHNAEFERYNNGMMLFNAQLQEFYDAFTRTHRAAPVSVKGVKML